MKSTLQGAIALTGQDIGNVCQKDGKTLARLDWLRIWAKNPRIIDNKNLAKLENQIRQLGVYKPLVITPDGEILGGNQRYKVIKKLSEKYKEIYDWVWVSIVEAWTDEERLKYALSDNFSAGEYTREKLKEVLNFEQPALFKDYDISFEQKQSIEEFINELGISEDELKKKQLEKYLKEAGVSEEIAKDVVDMSSYSKSEEFNPEGIVGCGVAEYKNKKVYVIKLFFENEEEYNKLISVYKNNKLNCFEKTNEFINYLKKYESNL
jgi:hypothetical protein